MAVRSVALTDTLETFRTTFNDLSGTDIGDVSTLTTTSTSVVGAINELDTAVSGGFTLGSTSVNLGDTVTTISGLTSFESASINATSSLTLNGQSLATQPFAIAQAIALG